MTKRSLIGAMLVLLMGCLPDGASSQASHCPDVSTSFMSHVQQVLSDTTGRFFNDYPKPTPLTCELLVLLQEALKDDSVRYHFEHLHQRYGDPRASAAFTYVERHHHFALAMAMATLWNPDTRIEAVRAVFQYRRIRPMVCATQEHYEELEAQDRAGVRYLLNVVETTPMGIPGSENSTIHDIYMREVMSTLDLFTGTEHVLEGDQRMRVDMSPVQLEKAKTEWRKWLEP